MLKQLFAAILGAIMPILIDFLTTLLGGGVT